MVNFGNVLSYLTLHPSQQVLTENATMAVTSYSLPQLPYAYDALEPYISTQIMTLHHSKHHQTYITNLNTALTSHLHALTANDLPAQLSLQQTIKFNAGGHINHSLFWANLAPASSDDAKTSAAPQLTAAIEKRWGSVEEFKRDFGKTLLGIQGSGWGWLVKKESDGELGVVTTKDQDPVLEGTPVVGVDMWEHAYYLQYLNGKAAYVENIWNVINWKVAEERFVGSREDVFAALRAAL